MIRVRVEETPPNKANSYRVGHGRLYTTPAVHAFEERLREAARRALGDHDARIVIPAPTAADRRRQARTGRAVRKQPVVTNPLFPAGQDLVVQVRIGRPGRAGIDVDGVKAVLDALNRSGIWSDDREVAILQVERVPADRPYTEVVVEPFHSPVVMPRREWWDITKKEKEHPRSARERWAAEVVIQVYCARCCVGIGQNTARAEAWYWPALLGGQEVLRFCCEDCAGDLGFPTLEPWRRLTTAREQATITAAEIIRRGCLLRRERKSSHAEPHPGQ